jgi:hypothetical protein
VNRDEARQILRLYRPGTTDAADPQIAEALALARQDADLSLWLAEEGARHAALRAKFRQIAPPAGLKEQILSEHAAAIRREPRGQTLALAFATVLILGCASLLWWRHPAQTENDLAIFRGRMVRAALTGYAMDLTTNSVAPLRTYLAQRLAPADYVLPSGLGGAEVAGCAIEKWRGSNVTMICFRTGKPLPPGEPSDLWLFVVDRHQLNHAPPVGQPELTRVNRLITATWVEGDKLYLLCVAGDEAAIRAYL